MSKYVPQSMLAAALCLLSFSARSETLTVVTFECTTGGYHVVLQADGLNPADTYDIKALNAAGTSAYELEFITGQTSATLDTIFNFFAPPFYFGLNDGSLPAGVVPRFWSTPMLDDVCPPPPPPPPACDPVTGNVTVDNAVCVQDGHYTDADGDSSHGAYLSAIAAEVSLLRAQGSIAKSEGGRIVSTAAQSSVNMP